MILIRFKNCRGKVLLNKVWIGLITNGTKDVSTLKYVDNSPFVNFSDFWVVGEPNGFSSYLKPGNVTLYTPSTQLNDDVQGDFLESIICYKVS